MKATVYQYHLFIHSMLAMAFKENLIVNVDRLLTKVIYPSLKSAENIVFSA